MTSDKLATTACLNCLSPTRAAWRGGLCSWCWRDQAIREATEAIAPADVAPTGRPLCQHCREKRVNRPRGLCFTCYYTPGVRDLYHVASKFVGRFHGSRPQPRRTMPEPTAAQPGTPEKVAVMEARATANQELWHPLDAGLGDSTPAEVARNLESALIAGWE